jgi:hypothetical protein
VKPWTHSRSPHPAATTLDRREFLRSSLTSAAVLAGGSLACAPEPEPPPDDGWDAGEVAHLLPTAGPNRIRLKASFHRPQPTTPRLEVSGQKVTGIQTDSNARFFTFDARGLAPGKEHRLQLLGSADEPLCDAWPLRTLPSPDHRPDHVRLLAYTCAGGPDQLFGLGVVDAYLRIAHRQRLFARALSFKPDLVVANGDHVYWDLQSNAGWAMGRSPWAWLSAGHFDRDAPILGGANEDVLLRAFGPQIADLYGVRFRSVPTFFLQDDHDYSENDEASDELRTFPPDPFMLDLARTTQRLYYPELLDNGDLPRNQIGRGGISESYGALRYGRLFEALLYDCRRHMTNATDPSLGHHDSGFVPPDVEAWLVERSSISPCAHLAHMPSTPVLWSAGKWAEWYPDFKDESGALRADIAKPYWPEGWGEQHDRLLAASVARADRTPLFVSGDLHALAAGQILASRGHSFESNPVVSVLCGAIGTGDLGWPSRFRGQLPTPSGTIAAEEWLAPVEENGFSLIDANPETLRISFFRWTPDQGEAALDTLEPFRTLEVPRPERA